MPAGEMSSFTYDEEGEVTGYSFPEMDGSTSTTLAYTARGEFASETFADGSSCPDGSDSTLVTVSNHYANGVPIPDNTCGYSTLTWDKHTGSITATGSSTNSTDSLYDAAGRQTGSDNPWSVSWTCGDGECGGSGTGERTRSYDAENHLIGDTYSDWSTSGLSGCVADKTDTPHDQIDGISDTMAYSWGPNGHPDRWVGGIGFSALTLHWDGDTPLFITDNSGTLQEIKIEGLGFYAPSATNPMTFIDRDQSGFVVAAHWNGGTGPWTASNPFHQTCDGEAISGYALFEPGPDGVTDTVNMMQGVRSYDPALGTWTSPDAYAGDASDPMSRKSFMWNRNNSYTYSDPTGFDGTMYVDGNNITITAKIYFTPDSTASKADRAQFIANVDRRLSGKAGKYNVTFKATEVSGPGDGVTGVKLTDTAGFDRSGGDNDVPTNGGPGGIHNFAQMGTTTWFSSHGFPDAEAGSESHELFHTFINSWSNNGYHNPGGPDLMNGGWPSSGLSESDIDAALSCGCNTVVNK
jgi:hypothetical protein